MKQNKNFSLKKKKIKMADSKILSFSTLPKAEQFLPKFHGLVLRLVELIDAKGINMTQPIPMKISHKLCVRMDGTQFLIL